MAELKTLVRCRRKLELVLQDSEVLLYLQDDEVDYPRQMTPAEIVAEIKRLVKGDPQLYHKLLNYLNQDSKYEECMEALNKEYDRVVVRGRPRRIMDNTAKKVAITFTAVSLLIIGAGLIGLCAGYYCFGCVTSPLSDPPLSLLVPPPPSYTSPSDPSLLDPPPSDPSPLDPSLADPPLSDTPLSDTPLSDTPLSDTRSLHKHIEKKKLVDVKCYDDDLVTLTCRSTVNVSSLMWTKVDGSIVEVLVNGSVLNLLFVANVDGSIVEVLVNDSVLNQFRPNTIFQGYNGKELETVSLEFTFTLVQKGTNGFTNLYTKELAELDPQVYALLLGHLKYRSLVAALKCLKNHNEELQMQNLQDESVSPDDGHHSDESSQNSSESETNDSPHLKKNDLFGLILMLIVAGTGLAAYSSHEESASDTPSSQLPQPSRTQTPDPQRPPQLSPCTPAPQPTRTPDPQRSPQPSPTPAPQQLPQASPIPAPQQPPQASPTPAPQQLPPSHPPPSPAGGTGCKEIKSSEDLFHILEEVDVKYKTMCRSLLPRKTCIRLKNDGELNPQEIAEEYFERHHTVCVEDILRHLCKDFEKNRYASEIATKYFIPFSEADYC